ncbi:MAG: hypothetical protein ISR77_03135 [Pirellulaceae bacterium]|nr:hypothetical protein [Pirellulaceae bacterium]
MPERTEVIGVPVIGVQTTFGVMAVLKGNLKGRTFNLHHYRFDTETIKSDTRFVYDHHAGLAEFGKGNDGVGEVYLLFLKLKDKNSYVPVQGHVDVCLSVKRLVHPPDNDPFDGAKRDTTTWGKLLFPPE